MRRRFDIGLVGDGSDGIQDVGSSSRRGAPRPGVRGSKFFRERVAMANDESNRRSHWTKLETSHVKCAWHDDDDDRLAASDGGEEVRNTRCGARGSANPSEVGIRGFVPASKDVGAV